MKEEFVKLFEECQHDLLRYILGCIPSYSDALDVLQETAAALWQKFAEYDRSKPFSPWARKFAHIQVLKFSLYRQRAKRQFAAFSQQTATAITEEYDEHAEVLEARNNALSNCIDKLSSAEQNLLRRRYFEGVNLRQVAAQEGCNEDQLYRRLQRIRLALLRCIDQTLAEQGVE